MNNTVHNSSKAPLVRMAKREGISTVKAWGIRLAAIVLALIINAFLIYTITKMNPINVYVSMFRGVFGEFGNGKNIFEERRFWMMIKELVMLLCISVALAPAFKMRFWNIGAEGQVLVGGIATAACMIYFGNSLPAPVLYAVMIIVSIVAGAIWGLIPAIFKAQWGTNETLFTLMMNYIAIQLTSYFVALWENPYGSNKVGIINQTTKGGWLPDLFGNEHMWNVVIVLALTIIVFIYLKFSKQGYEIAVVGESENTAKYAGISVKKVIIRTMIISGAICGIAGFVGVAGIDHTISVNTAGGRGFTAIIIAWLAKFNTIVMVLISLLIVFLDRGASQIVSDYSKLGINDNVAEIIKGIILFFILGSEFFINYRLMFRKKSKRIGSENAENVK